MDTDILDSTQNDGSIPFLKISTDYVKEGVSFLFLSEHNITSVYIIILYTWFNIVMLNKYVLSFIELHCFDVLDHTCFDKVIYDLFC